MLALIIILWIIMGGNLILAEALKEGQRRGRKYLRRSSFVFCFWKSVRLFILAPVYCADAFLDLALQLAFPCLSELEEEENETGKYDKNNR